MSLPFTNCVNIKYKRLFCTTARYKSIMKQNFFFLQQSVTIPSLQSLTCATNALPKSIHQTSEMWKIIPWWMVHIQKLQILSFKKCRLHFMHNYSILQRVSKLSRTLLNHFKREVYNWVRWFLKLKDFTVFCPLGQFQWSFFFLYNFLVIWSDLCDKAPALNHQTTLSIDKIPMRHFCWPRKFDHRSIRFLPRLIGKMFDTVLFSTWFCCIFHQK